MEHWRDMFGRRLVFPHYELQNKHEGWICCFCFTEIQNFWNKTKWSVPGKRTFLEKKLIKWIFCHCIAVSKNKSFIKIDYATQYLFVRRWFLKDRGGYSHLTNKKQLWLPRASKVRTITVTGNWPHYEQNRSSTVFRKTRISDNQILLKWNKVSP